MNKFLKHIANFKRLKIVFWAFILPAILYFTVSVPAGGISIGYRTNDSNLKPGMVVSLSDQSEDNNGDSSWVERASIDSPKNILGIAVSPKDSLATITSADKDVYIENTGRVEVFTNDINGEVESGDSLVLSPVRGMLMKAFNTGDFQTVAVANESFSSVETQTFEIDTTKGEKTVRVAKLLATLDTGLTNNFKEKPLLEKVGESIIGKEVSSLQMVIALIMFVLIVVVEGSIIYGAISSGITSLGRNPLAKKAIRTELVRIMFTALAVLIVGFGSIFLVLSA